MNSKEKQFFSDEKLSYWYMTLFFSVVSVIGNSVTVTVIRQSKRIRRLVNFFLCMLAVNDLVLTAGNLVFVAAQALYQHRALFVNQTIVNWQLNNGSFNDTIVDPNQWKSQFLAFLRVHFMAACGGCQLWILLTIVMAPKLVMKTRITWPIKLPSLALAVPCLPFVFCSVLAVTETWIPCSDTSSLQPASTFRTCCRIVAVFVLWVFPVLVFLATSFRSNEYSGVGRSRFSSTLSALHRLSLRFRFPAVATRRTSRYETWTGETFRVIALAKAIASLLWLPFFGSLALTALEPCSDVTMGYVTWSYSALLCASSFPVVLFACSGKFRDGCKRLGEEDKQKPKSQKMSFHHNRNQRKFSAPVTGLRTPMYPLKPREATVESCFTNQRRTRSEDITSGPGISNIRSPHSRSHSLGGRQSHMPLNWKKIHRRVAPLPLAPDAVETSVGVAARKSPNTLEVPDRVVKSSTLYAITSRSKFLPLRKAAMRDYLSDPGENSDIMDNGEENQNKRDSGFNFMRDERL